MRKAVKKALPKESQPIKLKIQPLPSGKHKDVTLVVPYGKGMDQGRFAVIGGQIYTLSHRTVDLSDEGRLGMNDKVRRVYCSLAGIRMADLMASINAERVRRNEIRHSDKLEDLRERAHDLGYELRELRA